MVEAASETVYTVYVQEPGFEAGILMLTRHKTKLGEPCRYFVYLGTVYINI